LFFTCDQPILNLKILEVWWLNLHFCNVSINLKTQFFGINQDSDSGFLPCDEQDNCAQKKIEFDSLLNTLAFSVGKVNSWDKERNNQ
jgi:hypothetical protein